MFERPHRGEHAILVSMTLTRLAEQASPEEFADLAHSAGVITVAQVTGTRDIPDPHSFVGSGKLKEIEALVVELGAEVVLFNHALTPGQERNLERALQCRVLDRTGVILDIFAQRARSFEGKLQVELAQLTHLSTRLVRGWTHLERQKGGIGLRGPGETQLETDRRLIAQRIKFINKRLEKVNQQRELSRKARRRAQLPVVSLVGYTNAGKSTLFNRLTDGSVFAASQLFATLDATLRRVTLADKTTLILVDTVGFIQQLPHDLVAAFRATLEETRQATLLLHIVDASDTERQWRVEQVNQVLADIGAAEVEQIIIYNKIDRLNDCPARCERDSEGKVTKIWLSAVSGAGIDLLYDVLSEQLSQDRVRRRVRVPVSAGDLRARLFADALVLDEQYADNGDSLLEIQISAQYFTQLVESDSRLQPILEN
jgi:GTP-binding protein HflX